MAILVTWRFLDQWVALTVLKLLRSGKLLHVNVAQIPDVLFLLVCVGSAILWGVYLFLTFRGIANQRSRFCQIAGCAVPLSFFMKWVSKAVFGRTNTQVWLSNRVGDNFHWFQGGGDYSSFPSGHMAVFTAFFGAVWLFYPRYRALCAGCLLILAVALVATNHHFPSDVIAGAYLGVAVTGLVMILFRKTDSGLLNS